MSRSLRAALGVVFATAAGASLLFIASPVSSQVVPALSLAPTGNVMVQGGTASITGTLNTPCDAIPSASAIVATVGGTALPETAITVLGASSFEITVPGGLVPITPDEQVPVVAASITCAISQSLTTVEDGIDVAEIVVTKSVSGDAPADALFGIDVACVAEVQDTVMPSWVNGPTPSALPDPVTMAMDLAAGESGSVFTFSSHTCVFAEPDPLGASAIIAPDTVETVTPSGFRVLVTNTYATKPKITG